MKLAISIPDPLFEATEQLARDRGVPRSRLIAEALGEYIDKHASGAVTQQLNRVHGAAPVMLDEALARAQSDVIDDEAW